MKDKVSCTGAVTSYTAVEGSYADTVDRSRVAEGCFQDPQPTSRRFGETQLCSGSIKCKSMH